MKTPTSGPTIFFSEVAEQVNDEEEQRQLRQRQEQVREPHQRGVDLAARHARNRADQHADEDRDGHRREADRDRDAPAVEHAREQVLAEVVGAERVLERRARQARVEIDVVDRHLPDPGTGQHPEQDHQQDERPAEGELVAAEAAPRLRAPAGARPQPRARGASGS
jgi:hypothetical protein